MKIIQKIKDFYTKKKLILDYLFKFCFILVFYGIATNFVYWHMAPVKALPLQFGAFKELARSLAFGFLWYIIKVELPAILKSCMRSKE
jgi:hypothetical protein